MRQPAERPVPDGYVRPRGHAVLNLANVITIARLCIVPITVWLTVHDELGWTAVLFALAGISDAVDGWLARRYGGSALGAMLDPLADKVLLVAMFITLAITGKLPDWLAILVVFRDLVIVGGLMLMWQLAIPVRIAPMAISKANTALQLVLVATVLLVHGFGLPLMWLLPPLIWLTAASALVTGAAYVWRYSR